MDITDRMLDVTHEFVSLMRIKTAELHDDDKVFSWVRNVKSILTLLREGHTANLGPDATYENLHVIAGLAAQFLIDKQHWLPVACREDIIEFIGTCPSHVERGLYKFRFDCFSSRITDWRNDLAMFESAANLQFLEVGSLEGNSTCWLLDNILTHESSRITCIDLFPASCSKLFDSNIALTRCAYKVTKLVGDSKVILPTLRGNLYDFIYLDGSHKPTDVIEDAILAWKLLRWGGLMIFDDYKERENTMLAILTNGTERPDIAIDGFLSVFSGQYRVVRSGYQIAVEKLKPRERLYQSSFPK